MKKEPLNEKSHNSLSIDGAGMEIDQLINNFNITLHLWIRELDQYDFFKLCLQPEPDSWSIGQVYFHLIEETTWFISQIKICLSSDENQYEQMTPEAKLQLYNNCFPDKRFKGSVDIQNQPQPTGLAQLREEMIKLKMFVNEIGEDIVKNKNKGKTKHPGHNFFSAKEWFQYAEMHCRHHLKQKERIDIFLKEQ